MAHAIDINCDMGESYGQFSIGNDAAIFPLITSCNVACGFHGGDPLHIERTLKGALEKGVQLGAHPSYPDLWGFGRRPMKLQADDLKAFIKYQVAALCGMTAALGGEICYVKPHGALYMAVSKDEDEARAVLEAIHSLKSTLAVMGLANSMLGRLAREYDIAFIEEGFADRRYTAEGYLVSRDEENALIMDPEEAAAQAVSIIVDQKVRTIEGDEMPVNARSICVHGDHPEAVPILEAIDRVFLEKDIKKRAFVP